MNNSQQSLNNKVALVTGAGRGIGRAIAIGWAEAGARVACAARSQDQIEDTAAEIRAAGGEAIAITTDVTDNSQVQNMLETTVQTFGGLDLLLINAGGNLARSTVADGPAQDWVDSIHLNLIGAYYCAREAIPHLKARGGGKILTMGSGMGHSGTPGASAYCVSKAGLWMLVRVLAQELVEHNISVNEIIPGPVWTPATRAEHEQEGWGAASIPNEWVKQPEDVVPLALFLATQPDIGPTAQSFGLMRRDR